VSSPGSDEGRPGERRSSRDGRRGDEPFPGIDEAGPPTAPTVVFVHGAIFQRKQWVPQREALAEEFRVVALDLPGHGERSGTDFRLAEAVEVLSGVIETVVDGPAVLVGHSLGGYVATLYAYRNPETIDGLVVSGASANPVGRLETTTRAIAGASRLATRSERLRDVVRNRAEKWVRKRPLAPEMQAELVDAGFYPRQFGIAGPEIAGVDFRTAFGSYPGPALLLNGEADAVMRRGEHDHARVADRATVETVDGTGHVCNLEDPAAFTDAVRRFSEQAVPGRPMDVDR